MPKTILPKIKISVTEQNASGVFDKTVDREIVILKPAKGFKSSQQIGTIYGLGDGELELLVDFFNASRTEDN